MDILTDAMAAGSLSGRVRRASACTGQTSLCRPLVQNGNATMVAWCPLSGEERKTSAPGEYFRVWPDPDIARIRYQPAALRPDEWIDFDQGSASTSRAVTWLQAVRSF